jgi:hypothetical protein
MRCFICKNLLNFILVINSLCIFFYHQNLSKFKDTFIEKYICRRNHKWNAGRLMMLGWSSLSKKIINCLGLRLWIFSRGSGMRVKKQSCKGLAIRQLKQHLIPKYQKFNVTNLSIFRLINQNIINWAEPQIHSKARVFNKPVPWRYFAEKSINE